MTTLSDVLNVNHPNVYVRKSKLVHSIAILQNLYQHQILTKSIQIPFLDLKVHLKSLQSQLKETERLIRDHEQGAFSFGL